MPTKKWIKSALGRTADAAGLYKQCFRSKMLVVAFHRVTDRMPEDALTCSARKFQAFCEFFAKHFRVVKLSEQISAYRDRRDMGGTLSITFDDGYRDTCEVAAPILRTFALPAAFFVTTGFIGTELVPPWDLDLHPPPRWMDWDQVRSLRADGFEIGAHTDSHIDMGTANLDTVRTELAICQQKLERELGTASLLFAYPFGGRENITAASLRLIRDAGFTCCLSCCGGVNAPIADPFHLNRISIAEWFATPDQFGYELVVDKV